MIVTRTKWLITLGIDLKPNDILLDELGDHVTKLGCIKAQVAQKYKCNEKYLQLLYSFDQDTTLMRNQWKEMDNYLKGMEL